MATAEIEIRIKPVMPVAVILFEDRSLHSVWFTMHMAQDECEQLNRGGGQFKVEQTTVQVR